MRSSGCFFRLCTRLLSALLKGAVDVSLDPHQCCSKRRSKVATHTHHTLRVCMLHCPLSTYGCTIIAVAFCFFSFTLLQFALQVQGKVAAQHSQHHAFSTFDRHEPTSCPLGANQSGGSVGHTALKSFFVYTRDFEHVSAIWSPRSICRCWGRALLLRPLRKRGSIAARYLWGLKT